MAATTFGVIYGVQSGCRLRVIYPDNDGQLSDPTRLNAGEAMVVLPIAHAGDTPTIMAAVAQASGVAVPMSTRAVVLDAQGNVIGVIEADPIIGKHPAGNALFWHPQANVGDQVVGGIWTPAPAPVVTPAQQQANSTVTVP